MSGVTRIVVMALDVLGLIVFAAGASAALYPFVGLAGLILGAIILIGGARLIEWSEVRQGGGANT